MEVLHYLIGYILREGDILTKILYSYKRGSLI